MVGNTSSNFHVDYVDVTQHWHSKSQKYAGGDCLVTLFFNGWEILSVSREYHWFAGMRSVSIYYFELARGAERITMPVIHTPYVTALIHRLNLQLKEREEYFADNEVASVSD